MKYALIIGLGLLAAACSSVPKQYLANDNCCHYDDSIFHLKESEMTLNPEVKQYLKDNEGKLITVNTDNFENVFFIIPGINEISNQQENKQLHIGKWIRYRDDRTIKKVEFKYLNGTNDIRKETYYDQQGHITEVIDYEKGYNICWAEAIAIVKKIARRKIKKWEVTSFNMRHADLNKFPDARPQWYISLNGNEDFQLKDTKHYIIDGITGKYTGSFKSRMVP